MIGPERMAPGEMARSASGPYPFGYGDEELNRLGAQHRVWKEETRRLLGRGGFDQGHTVVAQARRGVCPGRMGGAVGGPLHGLFLLAGVGGDRSTP